VVIKNVASLVASYQQRCLDQARIGVRFPEQFATGPIEGAHIAVTRPEDDPANASDWCADRADARVYRPAWLIMQIGKPIGAECVQVVAVVVGGAWAEAEPLVGQARERGPFAGRFCLSRDGALIDALEPCHTWLPRMYWQRLPTCVQVSAGL
jgi:hypothetical protein